MGRTENQKLKLLYLKELCERQSDEEHLLSMQDILDALAAHGIRAERKSVYDDILCLQQFGMDIVTVRGRKGGYFLASRTFELPELKLLIDAVQSSRFLTEKKSRELIEKLCSQCSVHDARLMRRDVLVSGRVKSMNESIYFNVDAVQEAIAQNKQITFRYFDWDLGGKRKYRDKSYQASPYGLCQDNENCYLLAHSLRHGVTSYRLDRMSNIRLTEESRTPCPELTGKALAEHASRLFQMFSGEETAVKLRFDRSLINVVVDRFGKDIILIPDGDDHFVFTVNVAVSPMFLSWVIGFGGKAKILYPQSVADACVQMCWEAANQYLDQTE